jgi:hypothetical protein
MTQWTNPGVPNTTVPEPDHRRVQLEDKLAEAKTRLIELAHDKKTLALAAIEGDTRALDEIETVRTEAKLVQDKIDLVMDAIAALDEVYAADARVRAEERAAKREAVMRPQYEASLAEQTALLQEAIEYNRRRGDIHQASLLKRELEKLPETLGKSLGVKPKPMETANG